MQVYVNQSIIILCLFLHAGMAYTFVKYFVFYFTIFLRDAVKHSELFNETECKIAKSKLQQQIYIYIYICVYIYNVQCMYY